MMFLIVFCILLTHNVYGQNTDLSLLPGFAKQLNSTPLLPCPTEGPICATSKGVWKTFANLNELGLEVSKGNDWRFFRFGECPTEEPVCAQFDKEVVTFDNIFLMEMDKFLTKKDWIIIPCPLQPVCAQCSDQFRVFENVAQLKMNNKKTGKKWIIMNPCPICVEYESEYQVLLNATNIEVERIITGKNWHQVPCSELVCAKCGTEFKTFKNLLQLNVQSLMSAQPCIKEFNGICGSFGMKNTFTDFSTTTPSSTESAEVISITEAAIDDTERIFSTTTQNQTAVSTINVTPSTILRTTKRATTRRTTRPKTTTTETSTSVSTTKRTTSRRTVRPKTTKGTTRRNTPKLLSTSTESTTRRRITKFTVFTSSTPVSEITKLTEPLTGSTPTTPKDEINTPLITVDADDFSLPTTKSTTKRRTTTRRTRRTRRPTKSTRRPFSSSTIPTSVTSFLSSTALSRTPFPSSTTFSTSIPFVSSTTFFTTETTPSTKTQFSTPFTTTPSITPCGTPECATITCQPCSTTTDEPLNPENPFPLGVRFYAEQLLKINRNQTNNQYNGPYVEGPFYYNSQVVRPNDLKLLPKFPWIILSN